MSARCNIPPEEAERLLLATPEITDVQDEAVNGLFPHYLFYNRRADGGRHFECSGCRAEWNEPRLVQTTTPDWWQAMHGLHNDIARCPHCGRVVTLKQSGKVKSGEKIWARIPVLFLLADEQGGLYGRFALAVKNYRFTHRPHVELTEKCRFYWRLPNETNPKGMCGRWNIAGCWCSQVYRGERWNIAKTCGEPWAFEFGTYYNRTTEDYRVLGWDQLEQSGLRYCGYRTLFGGEEPRNNGLCTWLGYYSTGMPQLEFVAKLGLREFARELLDTGKKNARLLNWKQSRPDRFLRLRPETAKAALAAGLQGPEELTALQEMDKRGMRPEAEAELMRFAEKGVFKDIVGIADLCGVTIPRLCRYIREQAIHYKTIKAAGQCWADYIRECRALGYDLTQEVVVMPRNLAETHGTTSGLVKAQGNKALNRGYRESLLPNLRKKYEYDDGTYCILVPSGMEAIIGEGQRLKHCVGGYAERHVTGKTVILFLRESAHKTKSLCTIEMEKGKNSIRQIHGYKNEIGTGAENPRTAYAGILEPWLAWVKAGSPRAKDGTPKIKAEKTKQKEAVAV